MRPMIHDCGVWVMSAGHEVVHGWLVVHEVVFIFLTGKMIFSERGGHYP
jgi:hypothetical protein